MDIKSLARLGALGFVSVVILSTAIEFGGEKNEPSPQASTSSPTIDPLRSDLVRCQLLGEAGLRDSACLHAWAENRRRFMTPGAPPIERLPQTSGLATDGVAKKDSQAAPDNRESK